MKSIRDGSGTSSRAPAAHIAFEITFRVALGFAKPALQPAGIFLDLSGDLQTSAAANFSSCFLESTFDFTTCAFASVSSTWFHNLND